jgi:hypothetical protein
MIFTKYTTLSKQLKSCDPKSHDLKLYNLLTTYKLFQRDQTLALTQPANTHTQKTLMISKINKSDAVAEEHGVNYATFNQGECLMTPHACEYSLSPLFMSGPVVPNRPPPWIIRDASSMPICELRRSHFHNLYTHASWIDTYIHVYMVGWRGEGKVIQKGSPTNERQREQNFSAHRRNKF